MQNPIPLVAAQNRYAEDSPLHELLARHVEDAARATAEPWLLDMGELSAGLIDELAFQADANPPVLERYDRRGERVDRIVYHPSYRALERLSFGRGLVGRFYDSENRRLLGKHLWQIKFALNYVFAQAEQGVYCPIAMTDGAAHLLEHHGSEDLRKKYLPRLTATEKEDLWQGAMFLTEREGGSDVGANTTVARRDGDVWRISGEKWFCSNAGAGVMMVLARAGAEGTRGLGLFLVPGTLEDGTPNSLRIRKLKNKLGTRSMPTGEVSLRDAVGYAVGDVQDGFHTMTHMLTICRMHNAVASLALARRVLCEAAAYVAQRSAFGRTVSSYGLVQDLLCGLFARLEGNLEVLFSVGGDFMATDDEASACGRLMTPLLKLYSARFAVRAASESVELLGGIGYLEDSVTARFFRDAQVLPIWEGTTNILYLDALRAVTKQKAHKAVLARIERVNSLRPQAAALAREFDGLAGASADSAPLAAKRLFDRLWPLYMVARLSSAASSSERIKSIVNRLQQVPEDLAYAYHAIVTSALGVAPAMSRASATGSQK